MKCTPFLCSLEYSAATVSDLLFTNHQTVCSILFIAVKQGIQQSNPQTQHNIHPQVQPQNWFDTGDFVKGNEPILERGRQYPELMGTPIMYQQQQKHVQQQQAVQPVAQQAPGQQRIQPLAQNVVQQPESMQPQQVVQSVQQGIQPFQQRPQQVQQPIQQVKPPVQVQQQPSRPRAKVEKPPVYDYESNLPPRRRPSEGKVHQQIQPQYEQGQISVIPQQTVDMQGPQSVQSPKIAQQSLPNEQESVQEITGRKGELIQQVPPAGRQQAVSGKKGNSYGPPVSSQGSSGKKNIQQAGLQPNSQPQSTVQKPVNSGQQTVPQQKQQQQRPKGYYTDGGFIQATKNNMNSHPSANQRNKNIGYRNMFNKDRYGYQYQSPLYGGQRPYGRQYDNNYDYNHYAYGEVPASNYNYEYNSGNEVHIIGVFTVFILKFKNEKFHRSFYARDFHIVNT